MRAVSPATFWDRPEPARRTRRLDGRGPDSPPPFCLAHSSCSKFNRSSARRSCLGSEARPRFTTGMLFFQVLLLGGYADADLLQRLASLSVQAVLHTVLWSWRLSRFPSRPTRVGSLSMRPIRPGAFCACWPSTSARPTSCCPRRDRLCRVGSAGPCPTVHPTASTRSPIWVLWRRGRTLPGRAAHDRRPASHGLVVGIRWLRGLVRLLRIPRLALGTPFC